MAIIRKILIVISIYLVFGVLFNYVYADTESAHTQSVDPYQAQHGSIWLLPDNGVYIEALQMQTDVDYAITGAIARAVVKQQFVNNSAYWAEGIYVFPLPEKAAVDHFRMIIGERIIEGQVKERAAAKKTYETARAAGKKASLIEQQRPNVFTTSLANIAPGESISIEFEYQQVIDYQDQSYRLRFPMVVGPRYHPPYQVDDDTRVDTETDATKKTNPTRIHLLLDSGVNLTELSSSYHPIDIKQTSETRYSISTVGENIIADRDFELVWKPALQQDPLLTGFKESSDDGSYAMITILPPEMSQLEQKIQAREVIFVLDISGSMAGTSIDQAKKALLTAIDGLTSFDRFNIIWFNDQYGRLFTEAVVVSDNTKRRAKSFIRQLAADGGTEMLPALKAALQQYEFSRFRQVIFLTDGNISNEAELFSTIQQQLGDNRLFTIGIGSAPNAYFMRKAAAIGRGTFTYIGDINEADAKITALLKKIEKPALTNIELDIDRDQFEVYPNTIPDLYAGETATLLIRGKDLPQQLTLKGDYGNIEWQHSSPLNSTPTQGIRVAWAGEKISSLLGLYHDSQDGNKREVIRQRLTDVALRHHLVSRYTSLVAVDITPANTEGLLLRQRLKNNLPHGWKPAASNQGLMLAQTATNSKLNLLLALFSLLVAYLIYRRMKQTPVRESGRRHDHA